jgi:hypothetical protein
VTIERVLRNNPSTLTAFFYNGDTLTDPDGQAVTFTALKADGTTHTATTAATRVSVGKYTFSLPSQSALQELSCEFVGLMSGQATTVPVSVEIVGGFIFTIADFRTYEPLFTENPATYTFDKLADARHATEQEFERICNRAFVPRFGRYEDLGDGTNEIWTEHQDVHNITKLTIDGVDKMSYQTDGLIRVDRNNTKLLFLRRGLFFPQDSEIVIEYEHGFKTTPFPIYDKGKKRARMHALGQVTRVDDRVTVISDRDGGRYNLATPGMDMGFGRYVRSSMGVWHLGVPDIDVVLQDYIAEPQGVA